VNLVDWKVWLVRVEIGVRAAASGRTVQALLTLRVLTLHVLQACSHRITEKSFSPSRVLDGGGLRRYSSYACGCDYRLNFGLIRFPVGPDWIDYCLESILDIDLDVGGYALLRRICDFCL
jgi:hypothetical protein